MSFSNLDPISVGVENDPGIGPDKAPAVHDHRIFSESEVLTTAGWTLLNANSPVRVMKAGDFCTLEGQLSSAATPAGNLICTLSTEYRPDGFKRFINVVHFFAGWFEQEIFIDHTDGRVYFPGVSGIFINELSLQGMFWRTA